MIHTKIRYVYGNIRSMYVYKQGVWERGRRMTKFTMDNVQEMNSDMIDCAFDSIVMSEQRSEQWIGLK